MRKTMVAGNWKMHGSQQSNRALLDAILPILTPSMISAVDVVVCPPLVYLDTVQVRLQAAASAPALGAQNLCLYPGQGAYTGEVSGAMLRDLGCSHVIVGHSERRALFGESDATVAAKLRVALDAGLTPIACLGEQRAEREAGDTESVVGRQLAALLAVCSAEELPRVVLAYEPVWAIGTGLTASPAQAQEVHAFIRARLAAVDVRMAGLVRILYGGSVKAANAAELFAMPDVDGGLIGGASLTNEFTAIVEAASAA